MATRGIAGLFVLAIVIVSVGVVASAPRAGASPAPAPASPPQVATPDLGWQSPSILEQQTPSNANLGGVALSGDHTGMIVWEKDGSFNKIMATRFTPGAGVAGSDWQFPVQISAGSCSSWAPSVAMDGTGGAIAVWYDSCNYAIHATRFQPATGWTSPTAIDQPYWLSINPKIAMNAGGTAVVTWEAWDFVSAYHVFANRFVPGVGWGTAVRLSPSGNSTGNANVAIDASGDAIVTWHQYDGTAYHVYAVRYDAGTAAWSTPVLLETTAAYALYPTVAMDAGGNGFVAWIEYDGAYNVWANRYDHVAGWGTAVNIESQPGWAFYQPPQVAANSGNAVVTWTMYGPGTDLYSVFANRYVSGSGWATEQDIDGVSGTSYAAGSASVALDSAGNASIVYRIDFASATPANQAQVYALRFDALTGAAGAYQAIDYSRVSPGVPLLAMDSSGNALAAWNYNDNPEVTPSRNGILSNRYTFGVGFRSYGPQQAEWDESTYPSWLQLESNAAGQAIFSWTQNDGLAWNGYAALYDPRTGWSAPTLIEHNDFSSVAEEWSAIDGHGNAIVLFKVSDGTQYNVYATYYSVASGWGTPQRLDGAAGSGKYWLRISMNDYGDGLAVWQEYTGTQWQAFADFFNGTTHTWGSPQQIQTAFTYVAAVVGGIDGQGHALAVYQAWNGTGYAIYSSRYASGTGWSSAVRVSAGTSSESMPYGVAINEPGDAAVSWTRYSGAQWDAVVSTFSPAAGWAAPTVLSSGPGNAGPAIPSEGANGDTMVAYQLFDGTKWNVYAATRPSGGAFGPSTRLNGGSGDAVDVVSALDSRGNGFAAWVQYNGYGYDIYARRYVGGQGWLPQSIVNTPQPATPSTDTGSTLLAVDGHGDALLGWNEWHDEALVPFAAEYVVGDGRPSLALSTPSDGTLTRNASVVVSGITDPGATVTVDGTPAPVGLDGSFRMTDVLADGTHTFTVTATDAAGLQTTDSRTVTVDTTAPALTLSSPSAGLLTRNPVVQVSGTTEPGATVVVDGLNAAVSSAGTFSVAIALHEGVNNITATATDAAGNAARTSLSVTLDTTPPAISITSPTPSANVSSPTVTVTGTTEPGARVTVDGQAVSVDASGLFSIQLSLKEGANLITATATDAAGNSATAQVAVTYTNPAPAAAVQSSLASLNTMNLILLVLVIVSLALAVVEMVQIRKLRRGKPPAETPKSKGGSPPTEEL